MLQHKPDFERSVERFEAWWHRDLLDRPPVTLPGVRTRSGQSVAVHHSPSPRDRWMDVDFALERFEKSLEGAAFVGDTFPLFNPNLGPDLTATPFGAELEFDDRTSWSKRLDIGCREVLSLKANLDNPYWNTVRQMVDQSIQRGQGKWITGLSDLHCNADILAALMGPERVCEEMADDPDLAARATMHMADCFPIFFNDLYNRVAAAGQPATMWLPCLHRGRMYVTSSDFICLISPDMFRKTVMPALIKEMRSLEHNIFHLDGPGALRHLDDLLSIPQLDAIQWVFGEGNGPPTRWISTYQRIQNAGKSVYVGCYNFPEVLEIARHLKPQGVWFRVFGEYTVDQAESLLRDLTRWAAGKKI